MIRALEFSAYLSFSMIVVVTLMNFFGGNPFLIFFYIFFFWGLSYLSAILYEKRRDSCAE